jgi:hypothetical protein
VQIEDVQCGEGGSGEQCVTADPEATEEAAVRPPATEAVDTATLWR